MSLTQDEVVAEINGNGWNTVRWGWPPFSRHVIDVLLDYHREKKPEYFLIGSAACHAMQMTHTKMFIREPAEDGRCIGKLCGFPVYVRKDIPDGIIALVSPSLREYPGEKWEMVSHTASWIRTGECNDRKEN